MTGAGATPAESTHPSEPEPPAPEIPRRVTPTLSIPVPSAPPDRAVGRADPPRPEVEAPGQGSVRGMGSAATAAVWLGWAGTIVLLIFLAWFGYAYRTEVMHIWPASQRLYALLGAGPRPPPVH